MSYTVETPCCNYPSLTPEGQGDCVKKDICMAQCVQFIKCLSTKHTVGLG